MITVNWWGTDPDGFITGFEYSFDHVNWQYTTRNDSTFLVALPAGSDTFDFCFYIRAVDNNNEKDPTPAKIIYPVQNSPPQVNFNYSSDRNPARSYPVLKFSWTGYDPDGDENIDYYEICLNDSASPAVTVKSIYSSVIIEARNLVNNTVSCNVYQGTNLNLHADFLQNLKLNDTNRLYIRAVDLVGEKSSFTVSLPIYVRKPVSKILLVNAYSANIQAMEDYYLAHLAINSIASVDVTRVNEKSGGRYTELAPDNITQSMIFDLFDMLIWIGKDAGYSLSLARKTTDNFFNKGGNMFLAVEISSAMDERANYLDFTPIDSLVSPPAGSQFILEKDSLVVPVQSGWPVLKSTKYINPTRPFYQNSFSSVLYNARIVKTNPKQSYNGQTAVMAKKVVSGKTRFIISSIELHNLDGNADIDLLFNKIFKSEFSL